MAMLIATQGSLADVMILRSGVDYFLIEGTLICETNSMSKIGFVALVKKYDPNKKTALS